MTVRDADNHPLATATTTINIQSDWVGVFRGTLTGPGCNIASDKVQLQIDAVESNIIRINVIGLRDDNTGATSATFFVPFTGGSASGPDTYGSSSIVATLQGDAITFTDTYVACHGAVVTRVIF